MRSSKEILKKYWGYDAFRPMQEDIIDSVLNKTDTLALLATGGGKSITYQVPALQMGGMCLVISPLIALMQDQLKGLRSRGIKALSLNSSMSKKEIDIALDNCIYGDYKFLFISPERLNNHLFVERLKKFQLCFVAIDEAHCISQWGHDFRPDYLDISSIKDYHDCPMLALTATATTTVISDIQQQLKFKNGKVFKGGFERSNLSFNVLKSNDKFKDIYSALHDNEVSIVYTRSRSDTVKISSYLTEHGISSSYYHAGLSQSLRTEIQEDWMNEEFKVMVATNAFGMGIDKANVRNVIHYSLCDNPEAYFQEAGRAGRDQKEASVLLLYNEDDIVTSRYRLSQGHPDVDFIKEVYHSLSMNYQLAIGSGESESFPFDLRSFSKKYDFNTFY
jgi:ATP-dependent DNA helicase RecQ